MPQKKSSSANNRQSHYLPIVLWFLPLLAINLGYRFFTGIDLYWKEHEQQELANQEIEALAAGSDFSYQFARLSGEFSKKFQTDVAADLPADRLNGFVGERAQKIFRWPFPQYELFTFCISEKTGASDILFMQTDIRPSRRLFCRAFEHLVKVNKGENLNSVYDKQNEKMVTQILGGDSKSDIIARTQRGKASFASYRFFPHWFLWDYFEVPGKGTYGFFLFSRNDEERKVSAKLLALRDLRERQQGIGAFVPLFTGFGGSVLQAPLQRSASFKNWQRQNLSLVENDLQKWLEKGTPPVARVGRYNAFSFLGKSHTHLTVLLLPSVQSPPFPWWLFILNVTLGTILILLLIRGILLGQWPTINLRFRFITTYLLAATLPVSLLVISAYGYVTQYRRAIHFQAVSRLQFCIRQFDARKAQIHDEYRSAFAKVFADEELRRILAKNGSNSVEARDRVLSFFQNRTVPLPLLSFAIMDENGEGIRYYGGHKPSEADPSIDAFKFPLAKMLRQKILAYDPTAQFGKFKISSIQETSVEAYKSMTGNDLVTEVDKRRSFPITRQVGAKTATQMHELIRINGREKFAIFLVWDDHALDQKTFNQSVTHFGINNAEFIFVAFRITPQGLEYLSEPDRHAGADFLSRAKTLADQASFRGSYAGKHFDNLSLVAMPSKKYDKTILVGGTRHFGLDKAVAGRLFFLAVVLLLSVAVVLLCSFLSARIILDPITGLKSALDHVAGGRLNIEITSKSQDELGILCREFSTMTKGLRDREKLATLISAQAVDAIAKSDGTGKTLAADAFSGVALVSDIRNFTGLCEEHSPDILTDLLNEHFAQMSRIISENGGRIYKYIGDAIEAVFPDEPDQIESAAQRAFNAASLMLIKLMQINRARGRKKLFNYRIGIGLAYGQMYTGSVGSMETRLDYAILGKPLKLAARLESFSIVNPAFPLIVDEEIANNLVEKGLKFSPVEKCGSIKAFSLSELGSQPAETATQSVLKNENDNKGRSREEKEIIRMVEAGRGSGFSKLSAFLLGVVFVGTILAGIFYGSYVSSEARLSSEKINAATGNLRLIEQIKCDVAAKVAFEASCLDLVAETEKFLDSRSGKINEDLKQLVKTKINSLSPEEGKPSRYAVFLYNKRPEGATGSASASLLMAEGWNERHLRALLAEVEYRRTIDSLPWNFRVPNEISPEVQEIFGNQISAVVLHKEFFGRASDVMAGGKPEYFFWDYLTQNNKTGRIGVESVVGGNGSRRKAGNEVIGAILLEAETEPLKASLPLLLNSFHQPDKSIALIDKNGKGHFSRNFPADLAPVVTDKKDLVETELTVINEDRLVVADQEFRLLVCHSLVGGEMPARALASVLLAIAVFLIWFWKEAIQGHTLVNRSLSAKLWLTLLISAVMPLVTVFFVFGLFQHEDQSVRISLARTEIQRFTDLFELRECFADPLAWQFIQERTCSEELKKVAAALEVSPGQENLDRLSDVITSWYKQHESFNQRIINFAPRDIAIAGKGGWEIARSEESEEGANQFGMMLMQIARSIVTRRQQGVPKTGIDSAALEGEIVVETGLQTVRSLFGDDVYVRLSHGVGLPVLMHVFSGTAGLIIHAVPGIEKPDYVLVWLTLFEYESYLARIAETYDSANLVFPIEMHRYGTILKHGYRNGRQDLVKMASWISSANLPVSGRIKFGDEWFLLEGRPGIAQMTSLILGLTPERPIEAVMEHNRTVFGLLFLASLILILFIAKNAAADIIEPIKSLIFGMQQVVREDYSYRIASQRADELGALCSSFDSMMKGLEEKRLMGRMLSKNAQKFSLQESDSTNSKADFAFLYIGIPTFDAWMSGATTESLFADLKSQVALIASLIIESGGDIDKIIGEKILAVFHADGDHARAAANACHAAAKIMSAEGRGQLPFPVAIGVNLGSVITGFLGVGEKRDFTVIGDAVNVTARIEGLAESMRYQRCLVSEKIFALLPVDCTAREYGEVELKGKSEPMKVFQLNA